MKFLFPENPVLRFRRQFFITALTLLLLNLGYGYVLYWHVSSANPQPDAYLTFRRYWDAAQIARLHYVNPEKSSLPRLLELSLHGMIGGLDPFCRYYSPEATAFQERLRTEKLCGIGVELGLTQGRPEVLAVMPGSPAHYAGIEEGDILTHLNGEVLDNLELFECRNRIIGEKGSNVEVTFERDDGRCYSRSVIRGAAAEADISGPFKADSHIDLIRIADLPPNAAGNFERVLRESLAQGSQGIILDLRGCPGGNFAETLAIADLLLKSNAPVVTLSGRDGQKHPYRASGKGHKETAVALAVLVDPNTASCAEILSAALKDNGRAVVIGEPTYGKGFAQQTFPIPDGGTISVTTADYLTAGGYSIHKRGIEPTFYLPLSQSQRMILTRQRVRYPGVVKPEGDNWIEDKALAFALSYLKRGAVR